MRSWLIVLGLFAEVGGIIKISPRNFIFSLETLPRLCEGIRKLRNWLMFRSRLDLLDIGRYVLTRYNLDNRARLLGLIKHHFSPNNKWNSNFLLLFFCCCNQHFCFYEIEQNKRRCAAERKINFSRRKNQREDLISLLSRIKKKKSRRETAILTKRANTSKTASEEAS